ncbi:acyltransferase family protein [Chromobacterium subtsugae]|uniref:acyltransferase family protein n=1 Tax=Chromobacterium subtsugae TaxID=251747 RepID=UPI000ADC2287|nr:acyltransferase family protein [Chromobacterium subtsugae]
MDINGLRAIAVLSVVLYHFGIPGFSGGFIGVDIFFVISGFLITAISTQQLQTHSFSYISFLSKRAKRIFPALSIMILACIIWAGYSYLPSDYIELVRRSSAALIFRTNYSFVSDTGYFAPDTQLNILLHTWSLSLEFQFYIIFALLAKWLLSPQKSQSSLLKNFILCALLLSSFIWCIYITEENQPKAFYLLWSRAWEFMAGGLIAIYGSRPPSPKTSSILGLAGLTLLFSCLFLFDAASMPYPGWRAMLPTIATVMVLYAKNGWTSRALSHEPLQTIGKISYSVYLWHWPILVAFRERMGRDPSINQAVFLIFAVLVLGWASYQLIEKPSQKKISNRQFSAASFLVIISCFAFSEFLSQTAGWPHRLPDYFQPVVESFKPSNPRIEECMREVDGTKKTPGDFCRIGIEKTDGTPPDMMLWGDSFADALQSVADYAAKSHNLSGIVATQGGCPPFKGKAFPGSGADIFSGCEKYANFAYEYFERTPSIKFVIIAGDWQRYEANYEGSIIRSIAEMLSQRGGRMILVGATPNPHGDVPRQWARKQFQAGHEINEISVPIEKQTQLIQHVARISLPASKIGNVKIIEPFQTLCASNQCYAVKDGKAIFRDTDHLSIEGIRLISPLLIDAVNATFNQTKKDAIRETGQPLQLVRPADQLLHTSLH